MSTQGHEDRNSHAHAELEQLRAVHRRIARELHTRLLAAEVEVVGLTFLHRADPTPRLARDLAEGRDRCKRLRRGLALEFAALASHGLALWAREQKRLAIRDVLAARAEAWTHIARVRQEHVANVQFRARVLAETSAN
jgi:hypothetical protein